MYRINILTSGKYNNVRPGFRYCITKKSAKEIIDDLMKTECSFEVEKLIRIHSDVYSWSDHCNDVCGYYNEKLMVRFDEPDSIDNDCGFDPYIGCFSDDC